MAYNSANKYSGNSNRTAATKPVAAAVTGEKGGSKTPTIFQTGLWSKEDGKSLATVQVKEDVVIPAGSFINLYQTDPERMKENSPQFKITVKPGSLKANK